MNDRRPMRYTLLVGAAIALLGVGSGCGKKSDAPPAATDPGAIRCKQLIADAYENINGAHRTDRRLSDPCAAEELAAEAVALLKSAQQVCGPYFKKMPMQISQQALTNAENQQERLAAKCAAERRR